MVRFSHFEYSDKHWSPLSEVGFSLPKLQAHRGYWVEGQGQNTLGAVEAAATLGFRMAEVDLRLTRDRVPVLFHDPFIFDVDQARKIRDLNLSELKGLIPVSTLSEVLEQTPDDFYLNLEIKNESKTDFSLEEHLIQSLKDSPDRGRILFSSFNPFSLAWMVRLMPEIPRALLVSQERADWNSLLLRELTFLRL
ncbi:MAG: glycerophosphodiester phosphodiesterase, partial [Bdellovibrionales bacterium]